MASGSDGECLKWLEAQGLVLKRGPRPAVIWGDVLRRLRELEATPSPVRPAPKLARTSL